MAGYTYTDEQVDHDGGREDSGAAAWRHVAELTDDLRALAAFGERDNCRRLRLKELRFLVVRYTDEHYRRLSIGP